MARRVLFGALALATVLCLSACGGPDGNGGTGGGSATASSSGTSSPGSGTRTAEPTGGGSGERGGNGGGGDKGFAYVPWGPDDPPIPTQYAVLAASGSRPPRCEDIPDDVVDAAFWAVAGRVCLAMRDGTSWPETANVPSPPSAENAYQGCLNAELTAMLERALRWHVGNPGRRPVVSYPSESATSPCQARLYELRTLEVGEAEDIGCDPGAKIAVMLDAPPGRDGDLDVTVNGRSPAVDDVCYPGGAGDGLERVVIFVSPPEQPAEATFAVSNGRGTMTGTVDLPAATGSGTSSDSGGSGGSGGPDGSGDTGSDGSGGSSGSGGSDTGDGSGGSSGSGGSGGSDGATGTGSASPDE